ncbi:hypothetical protein [Streptomyces sp. N2A]|uniref:hypothetical protein n=1 Tax=Streptomyces sp. N2A TaxID=3073936 RepID=UPI00286FBFFC|nr:hypothetical protein [Streptomyces sp. N2A]
MSSGEWGIVAFSERVRRQIHGVFAAATALALMSGCTADRPDAKPLPEGTVEASASREPGAEPMEALAAYRAMWRDLSVASETSDASSPVLDDHATGGALQLMKYGLRKAKREKVVSKGTPRVDPKVIRAAKREVVLRDCVDDRHWLQYKLNGELKNSLPGGHFRADATVRHGEGGWKVADLFMHETGSC